MAEIVVERNYYYYPSRLHVYRIVNGIFGLIEAVIALRIVLELFGASASSQFVAAIYQISGSLMGPFVGAFPNFVFAGTFVLDISAIFAIIGYGILSWFIIKVLSFIFISTNLP